MKRIIYLVAALTLGAASCSQDLDQDPPFNYPENTAPAEIPMPDHCILRMSFEETLGIETQLGLEARMKGGSAAYVEGKRGMGLQSADKKALLINLDDAAKAKFMNLGSFTLTMWINFDGSNKNAVSLFSVSHPTKSVSNLSLILNNHGSPAVDTDIFYFKGYFNGKEEKWFDMGDAGKVMSGIKDKWAQIGLSYDAATGVAALYHNGTKMTSYTFDGFGPLAFDDVNGLVIGAFPSMVGLSDASTEWPATGTYYTGQFDELYFYDAALSDTEMTKQYQDQM